MAGNSSQKELLALIYQHLVQVGYKKAAKKLQLQSGQKIASSPTISLLDIYTEWTKAPGSAKKRKANSTPKDNQPKKLRVSDPASSSESSEEDEKDGKVVSIVKSFHTNSTAMVGSTGREKSVVKITGSTGNVVNSTGSAKKISAISAKPASPAKPAPSKPTTPTKTTGIAKQASKPSESSDSSESEDEVAKLKLTQIPVKTAESSSETTSSEESSDEGIPASQTKSALLKGISATPVSHKTAQEIASGLKPGAATPNQVKAGTGKVLSPAKAAGIQKTEVSESSDSDDSEEEEEEVVAQQVKASPLKNSLATPVSSKSSQGKVSTPTPHTKSVAATPKQVKGGMGKAVTPAKAARIVTQPAESSSNSSDDSDSEEETQAPKSTAKTLQANVTAVKNISTTPLSSKIAQGKVRSLASSMKSASATPNQAKSETGKVVTPAKAAGIQKGESSESTDSSDSEEEEEAQQVKPQQAKAALGKNLPASPVSSKSPQGKVSTPAQGIKPAAVTPNLSKAGQGKAVPPAKAAGIVTWPPESSSESSEDSESEEDTHKPKPIAKAAVSKISQANTTAAKSMPGAPLSSKIAPGTKSASATPNQAKAGRGNAVTPAKAAEIKKEESSDSSDSSDSEEDEAQQVKPSPKLQKAKAGQGKAVTPAKAAGIVTQTQESSSDSSDDSDSEEETQKLKPAALYKTFQSNITMKNIPITAVPSKIVQGKASGLAAGMKSTWATPNQVKAGTGKVVTPAKAAEIEKRESSESSDSSDSEEEEEAQQVKPFPKPLQAVATPGKIYTPVSVTKSAQGKVSTPSQGTKPAAATSKLTKGVKGKAMTPAEAAGNGTESSSDSSDYSDCEEETGKNAKSGKPAKPAAKNVLANSTSKAKPDKSKGVTPRPTKAVAKQYKTSNSNEDLDDDPATPAQKGIQAFTVDKSVNVNKSSEDFSDDDGNDDADPTQSLLAALSLFTKNYTAMPAEPQNSKVATVARAIKGSGKVSRDDISESESSVTDTETVKPSSKPTPRSVPASSQERNVMAKNLGAKQNSTGKKAKDKNSLASKAVENDARKAMKVSKSKPEENDFPTSQQPVGTVGNMATESLLSLERLMDLRLKSASKTPKAKTADDDDDSEEEEEKKRKIPAAKAVKEAEIPETQTSRVKESKKKKSAKKLKLASGDATMVTKKKSGQKKKGEKKKKKDKKKKSKKISQKDSSSTGISSTGAEDFTPSLKSKKKKKKTD
ncbi:treacle protein isoform X2 [Microcaecilia unicolor]|uniref:Treacle protein isoform X2 n=1 Tax=Microcaecilia unicolor TaxID=1415580 RepID=A0A6P7YWA4_9AMPH|nr:treacle protein isoform X2 [Microcaecilia unicolor]